MCLLRRRFGRMGYEWVGCKGVRYWLEASKGVIRFALMGIWINYIYFVMWYEVMELLLDLSEGNGKVSGIIIPLPILSDVSRITHH